MEMSNKNSVATVIIACFILGLAGLIAALAPGGLENILRMSGSQAAAAVVADLSTADDFAVLASTYTNTAAGTTINGNLGYTTAPVFPPTVNGVTHVNDATYAQAGIDQGDALVALDAQGCDFSFGSATDLSLLPQPLVPGVYCVTGAASIGTGGITLSGSEAYVFRISGALTTVVNSIMTMTGGASACNVFWTPTSATTLGADSTFMGTIIDDAGITVGANTTWTGRALAFGGTVTTDADTISVPVCAAASATLTLVKTVVNDSGGTAVAGDFQLLIFDPVANSFSEIDSGDIRTLDAGSYTVSENGGPVNYTASAWSGDCNADGTIVLSPGQDATCTIINDDIPAVPPTTGTLHVIKSVINTSGGTATSSNFTLHVKDSGNIDVDVSGNPGSGLPGVPPLGRVYTLSPGTYTVSEDLPDPLLYTQSFFGANCVGGSVTVVAGEDRVCTIINTDIPPPVLVAPSSGGGSSRVIPLIGILKVPTPLALPGGSGSVTYNYTVWNAGGQRALTDVTVTDDKCSPVTLLSGNVNNDDDLDIDEVWKYSCTTTLLTTTTNTAIATGYGADSYHDVTVATAIVTVVVGIPGLPDTGIVPSLIDIVKIPSRLTPFPFGGGSVTYTYTVTNPGVVPLREVTVTDDKCASVSRISGDTDGDDLLDPSETWKYTCQTNVPVSTTNVATALGKVHDLIAIDYAFATVLVATPGLPNTGLPPL